MLGAPSQSLSFRKNTLRDIRAKLSEVPEADLGGLGFPTVVVPHAGPALSGWGWVGGSGVRPLCGEHDVLPAPFSWLGSGHHWSHGPF